MIERRQKAVDSFGEYFGGLVAEHKAHPRDDLLSALIAAEEAGDKLSEEELLATCILLLVAGHETTVNLIGNGTLALLRTRTSSRCCAAIRRWHAAPSRSSCATTRRCSSRRASRSRTSTLNGVTLKKGEQAILLLASANRDPDVFVEPDRLDITRPENRHLAFSHGIHYCVGAPLARLEAEVALATMVQRFPTLRLLGRYAWLQREHRPARPGCPSGQLPRGVN